MFGLLILLTFFISVLIYLKHSRHPGENMNYSNQMKGQNKKTILHGSPDYNNKNPKKVVAKNPIGKYIMI